MYRLKSALTTALLPEDPSRKGISTKLIEGVSGLLKKHIIVVWPLHTMSLILLRKGFQEYNEDFDKNVRKFYSGPSYYLKSSF